MNTKKRPGRDKGYLRDMLPVAVAVGDKLHTLKWQPVPHYPEVWTALADEVACLAIFSHNCCIVGYLNAFPFTGTVSISGEDVPPGFGRWFLRHMGRPDDPGTATRHGRENAKRHPIELRVVHGVEMYGGPDANSPGGAGIYHESDWATGCSDGLLGCIQMLMGWCNRSWIFRLCRESWEQGRVVPFRLSMVEDYGGHDRTSTIQPKGYEGPSRIYGEWSVLDYSHIVRQLHPAAVLARQEKKAGVRGFGTIILEFLFEDCACSWLDYNQSDLKDNFWWWSLGRIVKESDGQGSPHLSRAANGMLQILSAYALRYNDADCLIDAVLSIFHCYDEQRRVVYRLSHLTEDGSPSYQYNHKVYQEGWRHSIPVRQTPDVYKGFEQELVYLGLRRAEMALHALTPNDELLSPTSPWVEAGLALDKMISELRERFTSGTHRQLEVIEYKGWSSIDVVPFTRMICQTATTAEVRAAHTKLDWPWWSDNEMNAWTGGLDNLE